MGKYRNRFASASGRLSGLQYELETTNRLLAEILAELKKANQEPRGGFVPPEQWLPLPPGQYPAGPPLRQRVH